MDKASIVGDAIDYVKELQQEVDEMELEISDLERSACHVAVNESSAGSLLSDCEERAAADEELKEAEFTVVTEPNDNIEAAAAATETENTKPLVDNCHGSQPPVLEKRILIVSSNDDESAKLSSLYV